LSVVSVRETSEFWKKGWWLLVGFVGGRSVPPTFPITIIFIKNPTPMLKFIYGNGGKNMVIFSAICEVAGILVFIFFKEIRDSNNHGRGSAILHFCTETLGRYGFSGFLFFGGMLIGIRGLLEMRRVKQEENIQQ
jgi:hypothetical protein